MTHMPPFAAACAALALLFAAAAHAEDTVYKSVGPNGVVTYTNSPQGLRNAAKVKLPDAPLSGGVALGADSAPAAAPAQASASDDDAAKKVQAKRMAAVAAQAELDRAIKAQAEGQEPLEGERTGTANGTSRLNPAYFERQKALADAVEAAKAKLAQLR